MANQNGLCWTISKYAEFVYNLIECNIIYIQFRSKYNYITHNRFINDSQN